MDDFSSETACVTPQNSPIDDWMSFPVKQSQKFLKMIKYYLGHFMVSPVVNNVSVFYLPNGVGWARTSTLTPNLR